MILQKGKQRQRELSPFEVKLRGPDVPEGSYSPDPSKWVSLRGVTCQKQGLSICCSIPSAEEPETHRLLMYLFLLYSINLLYIKTYFIYVLTLFYMMYIICKLYIGIYYIGLTLCINITQTYH